MCPNQELQNPKGFATPIVSHVWSPPVMLRTWRMRTTQSFTDSLGVPSVPWNGLRHDRTPLVTKLTAEHGYPDDEKRPGLMRRCI